MQLQLGHAFVPATLHNPAFMQSQRRWLWHSQAPTLTFYTKYLHLTIQLSAVKVKVHTLDIAPRRSESPPQKRSGMARVLKGLGSFTWTPTHPAAIGMSHICLAFPAAAGTHLPTPEDGRLSRPWCDVAQAEIRNRKLLIANPALYHTATSTLTKFWDLMFPDIYKNKNNNYILRIQSHKTLVLL